MGTFYFAWVDSDETTFGPEHEVEDEEIVRFTMEQNEGDFAELNIDFKNPRVGPLAASRKVWAWFSYEVDSEVTPIGLFRLVAIPSNILGEVITYKLIARPGDFTEQKAAIADTLRVLPFYDDLFIDEGHRDDPDVVLEGYTKTWDIDRITHVVSTTDFLVGEDGVEVFDETDTIDGIQVTIDRVPLTSVTINGEVPWKQSFGGQIQIPRKVFTSLAEPDNWPKAGDALAGGYYVIASDVETSPPVETTTLEFQYTNREATHRDGDVMSVSESSTDVPGGRSGGPHLMLTQSSYHVTGDPASGTPASAGNSETGLVIPEGWFASSMTLGIDGDGDRMDAVSVVVTSDLQPVLKDPADTSDTEIIDLGTTEVSAGCDSDGTPIVDSRRTEYVTTNRGLLSVQYMINRARARLIIGARVVNISWECPFERALDLSCRKNAQIVWDGIPGEAAIGKIVSYSLRGDGTTGEFRGAVKIACAVGLGNAITTSDGVADYVDEDYVDDYQTFTGQVVALPSGDIGYSPPVRVSSSGGIPFNITANNVVIRDEIVGSAVDQQEAVLSNYRPASIPAGITPHGFLGYMQQIQREAQANAARALAETQTWREIELLDLTSQSMESAWTVSTTPLVIPRQIDLTADVSA
jgi:hypothetical protein